MKYSHMQLEEISKLLDQKKIEIENRTLHKLDSAYSRFYSSFNSLFKLLCDEGIIKEDPYKEEYSLDSLALPDESPVPYNEEQYLITIRLSHLQALYTHLKKEVNFSPEFLTPKSVDKIERLVSFIDWYRLFDPQPQGENTVALNKILFLYQKDIGHRFVISTLKSTTRNIDLHSKDFLSAINEVKLYINECYKLWIRNNILDDVKLPPELKGENIKKAHDLLTTKIKENNKPIYINLIGEVLKEDFTLEGDEIKSDILEKLQPYKEEKEVEEKKVEKKVSPKELLENTVLELYKISSQIPPIQNKSQDNSVMFRDTTYSIFEKLIDYLKHSVFLNKRETKYILKIADSDNKLFEKEVELEKFLNTINKLIKRLDNYKNRDQVQFKELFNLSDDEIQIYVHQLLSKCRHLYKITLALDNFFKNSIETPKGLQVELQVIKSVLDRSQSLYQEYIRLKEEEQVTLLKRGVQT